jgi:hypothetical protein
MPSKIDLSLPKFDNPAVGAVYSDYRTFNPVTNLSINCYKEPFSMSRLSVECIVNCDSLVRKEVFNQVGPFDINLRTVEDYDLWQRASEKFLLVHIPQILVSIRVGEHSSTNIVKKEEWQKNYTYMVQKTKERRGQ